MAAAAAEATQHPVSAASHASFAAHGSTTCGARACACHTHASGSAGAQKTSAGGEEKRALAGVHAALSDASVAAPRPAPDARARA